MTGTAKKLERILTEAGVVTAQDLSRARRRVAERGGRLAGHLAAQPGFDDAAFARAVAQAFGCAVVGPDRLARVSAPRTPSRRAALRALAIERVLLPIGASRAPRGVEIAMFDPTDLEAVERLRTLLGGCEVRVTVAPRRALLEAIALAYGREQAGTLGSAVGPRLVEVEIDDLPGEVTARTAAPPEPGDPTPAPTPTPTPLPATPTAPFSGRARARATTPAVELANDLAHDIARLGDPDAPTPPPMLVGADPRTARMLVEVTGVLADLLERRLGRRAGEGRALARYARLVARQLGCAAAALDEIGVAARLLVLHRLLRAGGADEEAELDLVGALGWSAGSPQGLVPMLRALIEPTAAGAATWRGQGGSAAAPSAPLGAQVIAAVLDYLELARATPDGRPDRATVVELLRVTTAPDIIEALGRVLEAERGKEITDAG